MKSNLFRFLMCINLLAQNTGFNTGNNLKIIKIILKLNVRNLCLVNYSNAIIKQYAFNKNVHTYTHMYICILSGERQIDRRCDY